MRHFQLRAYGGTVGAVALTILAAACIRSGVMWNTSPPRPVTAQDVVRGIKRACNPSPHTFGGMADFESAIKGLTGYCSGYPSAAATNATVMKKYIESHSVSGIAVSGNSITFTLTRPAPWLIGAMTMPPFSAVPIEAENGQGDVSSGDSGPRYTVRMAIHVGG